MPKKALLAGMVGHALEIYDYLIFGIAAAAISTAFFSPQAGDARPLLAFLVFGAGYAIRPVGGLVLGVIGDTRGRRDAMVLVVALGAVATVIVGLVPTYAQIGVAATAILIGARLLQGLAGGGEAGSSFTFMVEYAREGKRGFGGSLQQVGAVAGNLLATAVVAVVTLFLSEQAYNEWGWRIPFLFAVVPALFALYIRLGVSDTPEFIEAKRERRITSTPLRELFRTNWKPMVLMAGLAAFVNVGYLAVLVFNLTYATTQAGLATRDALTANTVTLVVMMLLLPVWGALSDRIGRKPMLIGSAVAFTVLSYPAFLLIAQGSFASYLTAQLALGAAITAFAAPFIAVTVELFSTNVRVSGIATSYNFSGILFIGFTPAIFQFLSTALDYNPIAPVLYIAFAAVLGVSATLAMRETAFAPLRSD